jgi:hypothetical protein
MTVSESLAVTPMGNNFIKGHVIEQAVPFAFSPTDCLLSQSYLGQHYFHHIILFLILGFPLYSFRKWGWVGTILWPWSKICNYKAGVSTDIKWRRTYQNWFLVKAYLNSCEACSLQHTGSTDSVGHSRAGRNSSGIMWLSFPFLHSKEGMGKFHQYYFSSYQHR